MNPEINVTRQRYVWTTLIAGFVLSRTAAVGGVLALAWIFAWSDLVRVGGIFLLVASVAALLFGAQRLRLRGKWAVSEKSYYKIVPSYLHWAFFTVDAALIIVTSSLLVTDHGYLNIFPGAYLAKLVAVAFFGCYVVATILDRRSTSAVKALIAAAAGAVCWMIGDGVVPMAWRGEQALTVLASFLMIAAVALLVLIVRKQVRKHGRQPSEI